MFNINKIQFQHTNIKLVGVRQYFFVLIYSVYYRVEVATIISTIISKFFFIERIRLVTLNYDIKNFLIIYRYLFLISKL